MYYRTRTVGRMGAPQPPAAQPVTIPASVGGVNRLDALIALPPQDCCYTFNLMPAENGMQLRRGYREYATGIGTTETEVRAIIPFEGTDPANDKLFAATADGIYDITTDGETSPTRVVTFSVTTNNAGYCNWTEFTTDAEETYLFVACPQNGLWQYNEGAGTWARPSFTYDPGSGSTAFPDEDVAFVALHKQRLWVVMQDSTDSYYTGVASIAGDLTKFTWGSKFRYGGNLLGLYTWSLDGGDGIDDYFVGISRGGDVLAYRGPDPSDAGWTITGSYFVGEMPASRRCVIPYAGELYILSTYGITSLRDLVQGVDASNYLQSPSAKINPLLRKAVLEQKEKFEWAMSIFPGDGFLQIVAPWDFTAQATQYVQNLLTRAWGFWSNVPIKCADTWEGDYYMGGEDGVVYAYEGVLDGVTIVDAETSGSVIEFSCLTSFNPLGPHANYAQVGHIRAVTISGGADTVELNTKAVYDYAIREEALAPGGDPSVDASAWDSAIWGASVWSGERSGQSSLEGADGIGRVAAVAMRGSAASRLTLIGWDMTFTPAAFL